MRNSYLIVILVLSFGGCSQRFYDINKNIQDIERDKYLNYKTEILVLQSKMARLLITQTSQCYSCDSDTEIDLENKIIELEDKLTKIEKRLEIKSHQTRFENSNIIDSYSKSFTAKTSSHKYQSIESLNDINTLNGIITYVLFTKNFTGQNQNTKKYRRYTKLLKLIQELREVKVGNSTAISNYSDFNKFILMKDKLDNNKKINVETYNYKLSNKILEIFEKIVTPSFFEKEGPFLITVTKNILKEKKFGFLYVDLSTFDNRALKQALNSYKKRLKEKGDGEVDFLEKMHYRLLSIMTNFSYEFQLLLAGEVEE